MRLPRWFRREPQPIVFQMDNPCHRLFIDCEGDCTDCPNVEYFADLDEQALYDFDGDIVDDTRMMGTTPYNPTERSCK